MGLVGIKQTIMKRLCFIFGFLCLLANLAVAQPKSVEYEKKDFLLNVLWNPTFCLEDFREVGLTSSNTELRPMNDYLTSKMPELHSQMLKVMGKDDYNTRKIVYNKVAASWRAFKEIQYAGGTCYNGYSYGYESPKYKSTSLELRHKLSIVPLKLTKF